MNGVVKHFELKGEDGYQSFSVESEGLFRRVVIRPLQPDAKAGEYLYQIELTTQPENFQKLRQFLQGKSVQRELQKTFQTDVLTTDADISLMTLRTATNAILVMQKLMPLLKNKGIATQADMQILQILEEKAPFSSLPNRKGESVKLG